MSVWAVPVWKPGQPPQCPMQRCAVASGRLRAPAGAYMVVGPHQVDGSRPGAEQPEEAALRCPTRSGRHHWWPAAGSARPAGCRVAVRPRRVPRRSLFRSPPRSPRRVPHRCGRRPSRRAPSECRPSSPVRWSARSCVSRNVSGHSGITVPGAGPASNGSAGSSGSLSGEST